MKFLVLGDLHYKKNMYAATVAHLNTVMRHAYDDKVDFVIHTGDFCNDYMGSPELTDAYLNNKYQLPVFGIYGNHELESIGNTMEYVTPRLCNREVCFNGDDVGYWYFDTAEFRIIGLDTNYSFCEELKQWQHNLPASWGEPVGNKHAHSLSPSQLEWLDRTVAQACDNGLKVVVFSHAALSGLWHSSPDAESVRQIFSKYPETVLMNVNGHLHTDHFCVRENIAYFDVNAVLNGAWYSSGAQHYNENHTFIREHLGDDDSIIGTEVARLIDLSQGKNTWFFNTPLYAVVEITRDGNLSITGSKASWLHGVEPPWHNDAMKPEIPDRTVKLL